MPETIGCDTSRFKQVLLSLLQWNVSSQLRGKVTVNVYFEAPEGGEFNDKSSKAVSRLTAVQDKDTCGGVIIEVVNSKSDLRAKEASRLSKLGVETDFAKILESKTDVPFKVTKVIANAIEWQVDFNSYRSNRMSFRVPALKFSGNRETVENERRFLDIIESNNIYNADGTEEALDSARDTTKTPMLQLPQLNMLGEVNMDTPARMRGNMRSQLENDISKRMTGKVLSDREKAEKQEEKMR